MAYLRIPFRNRHMKPIITGTLSIRLLMPVLQAFRQRFPRILRRKIHNRRRPACKRSPRPRIEIICRHRPCHMQIKMCMPVNKSRKKKLTLHIDNIIIAQMQFFSHFNNLFPFNTNIHLHYAVRRNNTSPFKQNSHPHTSLKKISSVSLSRYFAVPLLHYLFASLFLYFTISLLLYPSASLSLHHNISLLLLRIRRPC